MLAEVGHDCSFAAHATAADMQNLRRPSKSQAHWSAGEILLQSLSR
jgi:hypothetical protein